MRNALRYIVYNIKDSSVQTIEDLKKLFLVVEEDVLKNISADKEKIASFIANKIENGNTILTHCHSSSVTGGLIRAWKEGKKFSVICTETRPLLQGHRTAKELSEAGIPVTLIVDSAVSTFVSKANVVFVGCDVITAEGNVINKVGTLNVALGAKRVGIPFYVCGELAKFDPETLSGKNEEIEQRPAKEVWDKAPENVKIANPAFDVLPSELITAFMTQEGIVPPASIFDAVKDKATWLLYGLKH
jgi:ribose 1,5-bisphosphate isomerase